MLEALPTEKRRNLVSTMVSRGMSTVAIANRIGVPVATVRTDRLVLSAPNPEEVRKCTPEKFGVQKHYGERSTMLPLERRKAVTKLHRKGLNDAEISRALKIAPSTVGRDRARLKLTLKSPEEAIRERRAKVKELIESDASCKEIADTLQVTQMTVIRDRAALGYPSWSEESTVIDTRRSAVREMIDAGLSCRRIGMNLGVTSMTVLRDCEAMGIVPARSRGAKEQEKAKRRAAVRAEFEKGAAVKEIADKLGVNHMTVRRDIESFQD